MLAASLKNAGIGDRDSILFTSVIQNILVFIIPSYIIAKIEASNTLKVLGLCRRLKLTDVLSITIIMIMATPALNQIIYWNQNMSFPESLKGIENIFREWEYQNAKTTEIILSGNSFKTLITGLIVIGIITPLGEEIFFRAGLQRILSTSISRHTAIWLSALVFSALHMQFFGFIPRVLLGAFFGYLYMWTGSIWGAVFAHAFNNSVIVLSSYLSACGVLSYDIEKCGVVCHGLPWVAILSSFLTAIIIFYYRKQLSYGAKDV